MKILIKIFIFFICGFINLSIAQQYWIQQPSPTVQRLKRIIFTDTIRGWASGDSGTIINTTNSGINWSTQNSPYPDHVIDDMYFLNSSTGWCITSDYFYFLSKVIKTTNGGLNWFTAAVLDTGTAYSCITFVDQFTGFISGFSGVMRKTTNGGINWYKVIVDSNFCPLLYLLPKMSLAFYNAQTGFASGGHIDLQGIVWKTTDGGENWLTYCSSPEPLKKVKAISQQRILTVGGDPEYGASTVQSYDSGNSWLYDTAGHFGVGNAIAFRTASEVWVPLLIDTFWIVSLDSAGYRKTWKKIPTPNQTYVVDAMFVTPSFGWACGIEGVLHKYNSAIIGISENNTGVPLKSSLLQNYPNPFNPVTTIKYYLAWSSSVRIIIYDITGRQVESSVQGKLSSGEHLFTFDASGYASGAYMYKIEAIDINTGNIFSDTKKMILLK